MSKAFPSAPAEAQTKGFVEVGLIPKPSGPEFAAWDAEERDTSRTLLPHRSTHGAGDRFANSVCCTRCLILIIQLAYGQPRFETGMDIMNRETSIHSSDNSHSDMLPPPLAGWA